MSIIFTNTYQQTWSCSGAPQTSATLANGGIIYIGDTVTDTTTGNQYVVQSFTFDSVNQIYNNLVYQQIATSYNFSSLLPVNLKNSEINTTRSFASISLAFNTARQSSATNDTVVIANISLTSTVLLAAIVYFQVNTGSGFSTIAEISVSGLAATTIQSVNVSVPAGANYKLIQASGASSIISIQELTM